MSRWGHRRYRPTSCPPSLRAAIRLGNACGPTRFRLCISAWRPPASARISRRGTCRRRGFGGGAPCSAARVDEAVRGSRGRARGLRRDARLRRLPHATLDQDQDEQRHRAAEQGDPPPNSRRRHVPRREIRADAGDRQATHGTTRSQNPSSRRSSASW